MTWVVSRSTTLGPVTETYPTERTALDRERELHMKDVRAVAWWCCDHREANPIIDRVFQELIESDPSEGVA